MADEEEEAVRLQREAAAALRPEDYGLSEGSEEEGGSSEEEESGAAPARHDAERKRRLPSFLSLPSSPR